MNFLNPNEISGPRSEDRWSCTMCDGQFFKHEVVRFTDKSDGYSTILCLQCANKFKDLSLAVQAGNYCYAGVSFNTDLPEPESEDAYVFDYEQTDKF